MFFNNIKTDFLRKIRTKFLEETDIKSIQNKIEKMGFSTSNIYTVKNVKYLTAKDEEFNRIEFILSDKNIYYYLLTNI